MNQPKVRLNNGVDMPQLGLGVWNAKDGDETARAVAAALATGYRLIDTAAVYGNETGVGQGIRNSGVARDDIFVTSKLWNSDQGYDKTLAAFAASLKRLDLSYLDLYLIHWPMPARGLYKETWRAMETLYRDGRIRAIGVCNFLPEQLDVLSKSAEIQPVVDQIELNPYFQQQITREYAENHMIQVESWSPLGGPSGGGQLRLLDQPQIQAIANTYHKSPAQVVIRWHLQSGVVVIPKSVHAERIQENFDVFDFVLSEDAMQKINRLDTGLRHGPNPVSMNSRPKIGLMQWLHQRGLVERLMR